MAGAAIHTSNIPYRQLPHHEPNLPKYRGHLSPRVLESQVTRLHYWVLPGSYSAAVQKAHIWRLYSALYTGHIYALGHKLRALSPEPPNPRLFVGRPNAQNPPKPRFAVFAGLGLKCAVSRRARGFCGFRGFRGQGDEKDAGGTRFPRFGAKTGDGGPKRSVCWSRRLRLAHRTGNEGAKFSRYGSQQLALKGRVQLDAI